MSNGVVHQLELKLRPPELVIRVASSRLALSDVFATTSDLVVRPVCGFAFVLFVSTPMIPLADRGCGNLRHDVIARVHLLNAQLHLI